MGVVRPVGVEIDRYSIGRNIPLLGILGRGTALIIALSRHIEMRASCSSGMCSGARNCPLFRRLMMVRRLAIKVRC